MTKYPAVFLDRDGTLIEDVGFIKQTSEIIFYPYTIKALKNLQNHFQLFIITNQSGISMGITTEREMADVNSHIIDYFMKNDIIVKDVFCCPHTTEDNCECKKPKTFFIEKAAQLYNIDLSRSYIIGDHPSDVDCGLNSGLTPIYLFTGHGNKHKNEIDFSNTISCENVLDASIYIQKIQKF